MVDNNALKSLFVSTALSKLDNTEQSLSRNLQYEESPFHASIRAAVRLALDNEVPMLYTFYIDNVMKCSGEGKLTFSKTTKIKPITTVSTTLVPIAVLPVDASKLEVTWADKHVSTYSIPWLQEHSFNAEFQHLWLDTIYRPRPIQWKANEFFSILKVFDFRDVMNEKEVLLSWLESLALWGVVLIQNAGKKTGTLHELGNKIAFLKQTQYGETFDVIAKPGTSNVAYLSGPLQLHTDLPYYEYKPGVNLLHCLVQSSDEGGQSQLADGLAISHTLKQNYPKEYKILTSVPVDWSDVVEEGGRHFHSLYRSPVICENSDGEIERINFSQPQRDSHFNVPLEQAVLWYKAIQHFVHMLHSAEYKISFKMKEGEVLAFNNIRLLHGRSTYNGARHVQGGYLDWDHVYSRIRVLRRQTVSTKSI